MYKSISRVATKIIRSKESLNKYVLIALVTILFFLTSLKVFTAFTNFPQGDTLANGLGLHKKLADGGTLFTAIKETVKHTIDLYFNYEGRWFSGLFYAFSPAQLGFEKFDFLTGVLNTGMFIGGGIFFIKQICNLVDFKTWKMPAVCFVVCQMLFVGYIQEYNHWVGGLVYIMPYALCLIIFGTLVNFAQENKNKKQVFLFATLLVASSGTNQLHVLAVLVVLFMFAIAKKSSFFIISFVCYIPLSLISILAPGNLSRRDMSLHESIKHAIYDDAIYLITHNTIWVILSIPLLLISLSLIDGLHVKLQSCTFFERIAYASIPLAYFIFCPFLGYYSNGRVNYNMDNTLYYFWSIYIFYLATLLPTHKVKNNVKQLLIAICPVIGCAAIVLAIFFTSTFKGFVQILDGTELRIYQVNKMVLKSVENDEPIKVQVVNSTVWHHTLFDPSDVDDSGCAVLDKVHLIQFAKWFRAEDNLCVKAYR